MDRPLRAFQPAARSLERRLLLARVHVPIPPPVAGASVAVPTVTVAALATTAAETAAAVTPDAATFGSVWFWGTRSSAGNTQQVIQQGGEAIVWLQGDTGGGPLQVQVATDPSAPAVGVNLPAVNQTVTIPGGRSVAYVTIPTNAGAPNPGEVDVNLTITPIDPPTGVTVQGGPLELRILAPNATTPPKILGAAGTPDSIQLMFSEPMNPVEASNVHNYAVRESYTTSSGKDDFLSSGPLQILSPDATIGGAKISISAKSVPLRSASYDPADYTVTLIPKRKLSYPGTGSVVVTPGSPAKTSAALQDGASPAQGLTDLEGDAINQGGKTGKFWIPVHSGYTPFGQAAVT